MDMPVADPAGTTAASPNDGPDMTTESTTPNGGTPAPSGQPTGPPTGPGPGKWGVCLSGGGIRAAAYGLGALQALQARKVLSRADFISAVSGGSYIAAALALVAKGPIESAPEDDILTPGSDESPTAAFAPGSPEENYLRNNLAYLTHGPGGTLAVLGRAWFGFMLNIGFLALLVYVLALPVGWVYGWALSHLRSTTQCANPSVHGCVAHFHPTPASWVAVAALGGLGAIAGLVWAGLPWRKPKVRANAGAVTGVLLGVAAAVFVLFIGIPYVLDYVRGTLAHAPTAPRGSVPTQGAAANHSAFPLAVGASAGFLGLLASGFGFIRATINNPSPVEKATEGWLKNFILKHRMLFINILATISGPLFAVASVLLVLNIGAANTPLADGTGTRSVQILSFAVPAAVLAIIWVLGDVNSWSLHSYYKQHLSQAFALARVKVPDGSTSPTKVGNEDARPRKHECPHLLSEVQPPQDFPQVLICATANINDYGKIPTGFNAAPFVFSATEIGSDFVDKCPSPTYERLAPSRATLPTAVAVAGAAFSPAMGKMTRAPLRFLITIANLRLGVWIPNPAKAKKWQPEERGPRRWVWTHVLRKTDKLTYPKPRPHYLLRELMGKNDLSALHLYVTDGGHYENLGLVELLRPGRDCKWIWCIDASGETTNSFGTIGEAFAIARSELGVEIDLDPRAQMAPDDNTPTIGGRTDVKFAKSTNAIGTFTYRDHPEENGTLVIVKAGVTQNAPWDIRAYQEKHPGFPCDSTLNQLYSAERFDAYRALGTFAMNQALDTHKDFAKFVPDEP